METIEVVPNHEIQWEASAGEMALGPVTVRSLDDTEPLGGATGRLSGRLAGRNVAEQRPGGLRRRRGTASTPRRIRVRTDVLPEGAALLLDGVEPGDGPPHSRMAGREAACLERGQR